jgi:DNA-binding transcriptional ArsR family regulator
MMQKDARKILEIISEETRYEILKLLSQSGRSLSVAEIAERIGKDKKAVDKHLRVLMENELVKREFLEEEKAYGYYLTDFTSFLLSALEKIFSGREVIEFDEVKKEEVKEVKVVKFDFKKFMKSYFGFIMIFLGLFIGFGARIGALPPGNEVTKFLLMILFILIGIIYLFLTRIKK